MISEIQKEEYENIFHKECRVFRKRLDFSCQPKEKVLAAPLQFVFTGNISGGRWESLVAIGKAMEQLNQNGCRVQLLIYTLTPLSNKIKKALGIPGTIRIMGSVSADKVIEVQENADILVHVESLKLRERLKVHQSFSTKIVDYLHTGNCIFAVGTDDMASINYLRKNDAAVLASTKEEITKAVIRLVNMPELIREYQRKAWNTGKRNHESDFLRNEFMKDIQSVFR